MTAAADLAATLARRCTAVEATDLIDALEVVRVTLDQTFKVPALHRAGLVEVADERRPAAAMLAELHAIGEVAAMREVSRFLMQVIDQLAERTGSRPRWVA